MIPAYRTQEAAQLGLRVVVPLALDAARPVLALALHGALCRPLGDHLATVGFMPLRAVLTERIVATYADGSSETIDVKDAADVTLTPPVAIEGAALEGMIAQLRADPDAPAVLSPAAWPDVYVCPDLASDWPTIQPGMDILATFLIQPSALERVREVRPGPPQGVRVEAYLNLLGEIMHPNDALRRVIQKARDGRQQEESTT